MDGYTEYFNGTNTSAKEQFQQISRILRYLADNTQDPGVGFQGDADTTLVVFKSPPVQVFNTTLTAARVATLSKFRAFDGAAFKVTRAAGGAFDLDITDPDAGVIATLSADREWCEVAYSKATGNWHLIQGGSYTNVWP